MSSDHSHSTRSYLVNIIWSWLSVGALLVSTVVFIPILIRRLGAAEYGVWALAVSLVEYFWMIDLGFRPATVKFSAEYRALGQFDKLNRLVNTGLAYSISAGAVLVALAWFNAGRISTIFHIDNPAFAFLIRVVGFAWAAGLAFNIFAAVVEGFQRFDLSNRASIAASTLRSAFSVILVLRGYGLREMGIVLLVTQFIGYLMVYINCRTVYRDMQLSPSLVSWSMARNIFNYTRQILPGIIGSRLAQGALPSVIAYFKPIQFVTYFTQTQRMMDYAADAISRVGLVSTPRAADLEARGNQAGIVHLARTANRYCLALWGLWASYLFIYGGDLCRVWINRDFGDQAARLIPLFVIGYTFWMGQFISASVLMGIARYSRYSFTLLAEAVLAVILMAVLLPRFDLSVAVAGLAGLMILSRCVMLSYLFCEHFGISQARYLAGIYGRPLLLIGATSAGLFLGRQFVWPGDSWRHLISAGLLFAPLYCWLTFIFVVEPEHQAWALSKLRSRWTTFREGPQTQPRAQ